MECFRLQNLKSEIRVVAILIDGKECDFKKLHDVDYGFDESKMCDATSAKSGHSLRVTLLSTEKNRAIWGGDLGLHPANKFNGEAHRAEVVVDGIVMFGGKAHLQSIRGRGDDQELELEVVGDFSSWALSASLGWLSSTQIDYSAQLSQYEIEDGWEESLGVVKFLPVDRDNYEAEESVVDANGVRVIRSIDDYFPFLRVDDLVRAIIAPSGYSIESNFMESDEFKSLYMSGAYQSSNSSVANDKMGFFVKRLVEGSAVGDIIGRVSFAPYETVTSVGNIVDVATIDSDKECYSRGNCFINIDDEIAFKPLTEVSVGFEYHLRYQTEYIIESRDRLKGYDELIFVDNPRVKWDLVNRFEDRRGEVEPEFTYTLVVFDHEEGDVYYVKGVDSNDIVKSFSDRICKVTPSALDGELTLYRKSADSSIYSPYTGDWALYDGYIEDHGMTEVDVVVRSAPKSVSPVSPKKFDLMMIGGAEPGMKFTLMTQTSLRPYFAAYPGYGSQIEFKDVAQHRGVMQSELLDAIQHMYNLRFYSDVESKRLFIEPYDDMLDGSVWDWTSKLIEVGEIGLKDYALDLARWRTWGYKRGDGAINRLGGDKIFGDWSFDLEFEGAKNHSSTKLNPLFSPTLNGDKGALVVGDRDNLEFVDSLNFLPRVVRLFENRETEDGEPYATFHDPEENFTLCFEDRDGVRGLNRFYEKMVEEQRHSTLITMDLRLTPYDMTSLLSPLEGAPSLRSVFYFEISGERIKCRLERVESYSFGEDRAKCTFLIID